jgi:hypothetical protein
MKDGGVLFILATGIASDIFKLFLQPTHQLSNQFHANPLPPFSTYLPLLNQNMELRSFVDIQITDHKNVDDIQIVASECM